MYYESNNNNNVGGQMGQENCWNVSPNQGRRRCNCDFVYECLLELLAGDAGKNNRCNWVYACLYELLSDALEDDHGHDHGHGHCHCHCHYHDSGCACPR